MKNNGVIFLKDWKLLVSSLSPENQLEFWDLFTDYEYGVEQKCDNPFLFPIWTFIKAQMDNMKDKYNETVVTRNQINGAKGGRPKKETTKTDWVNEKPKEEIKTQENPKNPVGYSETQKSHNEKDNVKNNEKDNTNVNDILLEKESKEISENSEFEITEEEILKHPEPEIKKEKSSAKKEKFRVPNVAEVQEYCNERQNGISAYSFVNFYQSKGWKVGNQPMKDWKAAIRTWEQKNKENGTSKTANTLSQATRR